MVKHPPQTLDSGLAEQHKNKLLTPVEKGLALQVDIGCVLIHPKNQKYMCFISESTCSYLQLVRFMENGTIGTQS